MTARKPALLSLVAVVIGALILGATTAALREIDIGSTAAGFWRVALALPILVILIASTAQSTWQLPARNQWGPLLTAGACFAGDLIFWHLSLIHTTLGNATFLATLSSLWVPLTAFVFLRQPLSRLFLLGLTCALGGSGILVASHLSVGTGSWTGISTDCSQDFSLPYILAVEGAEKPCLPLIPCSIHRPCVPDFAAFMLVANITAGEPMVPASLTGWLSVFALAWLAHLWDKVWSPLALAGEHQFGRRDFVSRRCGGHGGRRPILYRSSRPVRPDCRHTHRPRHRTGSTPNDPIKDGLRPITHKMITLPVADRVGLLASVVFTPSNDFI